MLCIILKAAANGYISSLCNVHISPTVTSCRNNSYFKPQKDTFLVFLVAVYYVVYTMTTDDGRGTVPTNETIWLKHVFRLQDKTKELLTCCAPV